MPRCFTCRCPKVQRCLRGRLLELVEANHAYDSTLRVAIVRNGGGMWAGPSTGRASDLIALTADTKDWGHGVKLAVQPQARHAACEFAGAKILSWAMKSDLARKRAAARASTKRSCSTSAARCANALRPTSSSPMGTRSGRRRSAPAVCPASRAKSCSTKSRAGPRGRCEKPHLLPVARILPSRRRVFHHLHHARFAAVRNRGGKSGPHAGCADRAGRGVPRAPPPYVAEHRPAHAAKV